MYNSYKFPKKRILHLVMKETHKIVKRTLKISKIIYDIYFSVKIFADSLKHQIKKMITLIPLETNSNNSSNVAFLIKF